MSLLISENYELFKTVMLKTNFFCQFETNVKIQLCKKYYPLSEKIIIKNFEFLPLEIIYQNKIPEYLFTHSKNIQKFDKIFKFHTFSENFISFNFEKLSLSQKNDIFTYQKLSILLIKNLSYLDWDLISKFQILDENFISSNRDKVNWDYIFQFQKLSSNFIKFFFHQKYYYEILKNQNFDKELFFWIWKNSLNFDWIKILSNISFSENIIVSYRKYINNDILIIQTQKFSEETIEKYFSQLNNNYYFWKNNYSEKFISKYINEKNISFVVENQKLSKELILRLKYKYPIFFETNYGIYYLMKNSLLNTTLPNFDDELIYSF